MSQTTEERTEKATPERMKEVRRKGKLSTSRDFTGWVSVAAAAVLLPVVVTALFQTVQTGLLMLPAVIRDPSSDRVVEILGRALGQVLPIVAPVLGASLLAVLAASIVQGGLHFRSMAPKFEHLNPITGLQRLVSPQVLWEGVNSLLKTAAVAIVLVLVMMSVVPLMSMAGTLSLSALLSSATGFVQTLLVVGIAAGVVLAVVDLLVVRQRNRKHTMMAKKEVRDEFKKTEGDPLIRSERRARQLALSRNRMIAAVTDADVVVVNPTHFAVALVYEAGIAAPRVVAKGQGEIAARIRERAEEARVPVIRDTPLARTLHSVCDLDREIPTELYLAVARVLAFVAALRRRGAAFGVHDFDSGSQEG
jgi:flagellar biosynthesis protein FlhB